MLSFPPMILATTAQYSTEFERMHLCKSASNQHCRVFWETSAPQHRCIRLLRVAMVQPAWPAANGVAAGGNAPIKMSFAIVQAPPRAAAANGGRGSREGRLRLNTNIDTLSSLPASARAGSGHRQGVQGRQLSLAVVVLALKDGYERVGGHPAGVVVPRNVDVSTVPPAEKPEVPKSEIWKVTGLGWAPSRALHVRCSCLKKAV